MTGFNKNSRAHVFGFCLDSDLPVTSISILDFNLFHGETEFYSCFHIREDTRHILYTDKMEFHVLELPKLPKELREDCSDLELWAKFISSEKKEDFDMLAQKNASIDSAYQQLQNISQDRQKRLEYEARLKATLDYNQGMLEAEQRGLERGLQQGLQQAEQERKRAEAAEARIRELERMLNL